MGARHILDTINEKMKRRRPYLLSGQERSVTKEEAVEIWKRVKVLEKEIKKKETREAQKSQTLK